MTFGQLFGKVFICSILVLSGIGKLQNPAEISQYMVNKTDAFYKLVSEQPELKPYLQYFKFNELIKHNPELLIQCIGLLELLVALSLIMNILYFGLTFAAALVPITLIMHNPLTVTKAEQFNEILNCIKNLGFIGATMMMSVPPSWTGKALDKTKFQGENFGNLEQKKHVQAAAAKEQNKKITPKVSEQISAKKRTQKRD